MPRASWTEWMLTLSSGIIHFITPSHKSLIELITLIIIKLQEFPPAPEDVEPARPPESGRQGGAGAE